jgi:hypothetical protein
MHGRTGRIPSWLACWAAVAVVTGGCGHRTPDRITGTFFGGWSGPKDAAWWERELTDMKALGLDTFIFQHATFGDRAFYPGGAAGLAAPDGDLIGAVLAAAERVGGVEVHLGLGYRDGWAYAGTTSLEGYRDLERFNETVADDLAARYGRLKCWRGWYIPQELDSTRSWEPASAAAGTPMGRLLDGYYRPLTAHLRAKGPGKAVSIAPFFGHGAMPPDVFRAWYALLLESCPIDILMMQDGIGVLHGYLEPPAPGAMGAPPCDALRYLAATRDACRRAKKSFWVDLEVFRLADRESVSGSMEPMTFKGRRFPGIGEQIERETPLLTAGGPHGDRIVIYEYASTMSLHGGNSPGAAAALHRAYRDWLARRP